VQNALLGGQTEKLYRRARGFFTKKGYAKLPESIRQKNRLHFCHKGEEYSNFSPSFFRAPAYREVIAVMNASGEHILLL